MIVLQMPWTYTAPFHFLFDSVGLPVYVCLVIIAVALIIFALVEIEKAVWRRIKGAGQGRPL